MSPLPSPPPPPGPWQAWDLHPSVLIGLALLGGLYVYWGGLQASRRQIAAFAGALVVLGLSLNGPLHNLSDRYLFSAHMVQHLVLTLVFLGDPAAHAAEPDPPLGALGDAAARGRGALLRAHHPVAFPAIL